MQNFGLLKNVIPKMIHDTPTKAADLHIGVTLTPIALKKGAISTPLTEKGVISAPILPVWLSRLHPSG